MSPHVKVLIAAYDRGSSGIASYTLELAKLLSKSIDVSLLSFQELEDISVEQVVVSLRRGSRALPLLTYLRNRNTVEEALRGFDLVHETIPPWGSSAATLVTTRWGYVGYLHLSIIRLFGLSFPENLGAFPVTLQHLLMDRRSMARANYIVEVSREGPNFVPPPIELRPSKSYECPQRLRILFVSRDLGMPRKNLVTVLRALSRLRSSTELHLVGGGRIPGPKPPVPIINHGFLPREDVLSLMKEVDLLVLPSTYEELGFVGLEAYSVGLPVITSDIPSFRAIFRASPKFPAKDPAALAKLLESLTCEDLERIGRGGREYAARTNEIARAKILSIYAKLINERRRDAISNSRHS